MRLISFESLKKSKAIALLALAGLATGCVSAKSNTAGETAAAAPAVVEQAAAQAYDGLTNWTVVKGDNLWNISAQQEVYSVPEMWPLIYKANLNQIKDADLIYPGQVLDIPRDYSDAQAQSAVTHAKTRGAWSLGPVEAKDTAWLAQ